MEKSYCKTCDAEILPEFRVCPDCGTERIKNKKKNPAVAALLSCIVPGLGQIYAGELYRGLALFAALGFSLCLIVLVIGIFTFFAAWIFAVIDAYRIVRKQNYEIEAATGKISV